MFLWAQKLYAICVTGFNVLCDQAYCGIYTFSVWLTFVCWSSSFWYEWVKIFTYIVDLAINLPEFFSDLKNKHTFQGYIHIYTCDFYILFM